MTACLRRVQVLAKKRSFCDYLVPGDPFVYNVNNGCIEAGTIKRLAAVELQHMGLPAHAHRRLLGQQIERCHGVQRVFTKPFLVG